jgi:primary-amine oxidase
MSRCLLAAALLLLPTISFAAPHPLDPLSAEEIEAAASILRDDQFFPEGATFATLVLHEPNKSEVISGKSKNRQAFAILYDHKENRTFEAIVDLGKKAVASWAEMKGVQPVVMATEAEQFTELVRSSPDWQAAMKRRGIDPGQVQVDPWAPGFVPAGPNSPRFLRAVSYLGGSGKNYYGRPIEGVLGLVNMNSGKVTITDTGIVPIAAPTQELDPAAIAKTHPIPRPKLKPLVTAQPDGPSYKLVGNEVQWQRWRFRFALHPREGLVLYTVGYDDGGKVRPILYRASLSELVVPYGDGDENWAWRSAFDVGEYGVGMLATPLARGVDVPEHAQLLDAVMASEAGEPIPYEKRIAIFERDGGILWKHAEYSGWTEGRRSRELVLFFIASVGNYDYGLEWVFHQDGTLQADAIMTGIMLTKGVKDKSAEEHPAGGKMSHLVAPHLVAPNHQHFFNFRLDLDVDGERNSVVELNTEADGEDESLNDITHTETILKTEKDARRSLNLASARKWAVINPCVKNSLGSPTGYVLVPGENSVPYLSTGASVRKRAALMNHHFWATQYRAAEMNAAGPYPNQSRGGDGLPKWIADNQSLENEDLVVWYTLGLTHIPRPEEWPIMNSHHAGFRLMPAGFFSRNPALDVK